MPCSKKNCAYTFVGFGVTFLVLGIVCGFVIPKIVIGIVEDKACIDSRTDSDYDEWVKEKPDSTVTKLYYWEITNKDKFLYEGELPKLKQRGPYVYKQTTQKIDVTFTNNKRTSKTWNKKTEFSKEESCKNCEENDQITILNVGYVALMETFGGDDKFALYKLPSTISLLLQQFNNSYEQLGNSEQTVWKEPRGSNWTHAGFGEWIQTIPSNANKTNYTEVQMRGLYKVLNSTDMLFGETNATVKKECETSPAQERCGFLLHMNVIRQTNQTSPLFLELLSVINKTFCPNATIQCFAIPDMITLVNVYSYIEHVNRYTMWLFIGEQNEVVRTISQKNIALGYTMPILKAPVPGILKVQSSENDARNAAKESTFYTCEADSEKKHQWAAYDKMDRIFVIPNMTAEDSIVRGYKLIVPRSKTADKPCTFSHELPYKSLELFVSALGIRVTVKYKEETSLYGLELKRFTPNKDDFLSHSGVQQGYIDYSRELKFPVFMSFAHLLYANVTVPKSFNQTPDTEKYLSIVDVEAVTGTIVRGLMQIQMNVPIKENIVKAQRIKGRLNITYVAGGNEKLYLKSIPVLWGEYGGQASKDDIDTIKKRVIGMLGLSCGIIIALPVLGGIFIIVAIVLFVIGAKANQISQHTNK